MGSNIASAIVKTWTLAKTWCPNFVQAQEMRSINDSIGTALEENSRRNEELAALRARVAELEHFTQQVYDEAQEQHLVAQAGLLLHPLQP